MQEERELLYTYNSPVAFYCYHVIQLLSRFSLFHLEYQPQTGKGLTKLLAKHYRNQALFELHTLIFGLDVLGNPVSVVRGVVIGAKDLFYEPFKVGIVQYFFSLHTG